jgi:hypothetical protein
VDWHRYLHRTCRQPGRGGLDEESSAAFFEKFTPKTAFLLPTIATVAIFGGITLAIRMDLLPSPNAWLALFTLVNLPGALLLIGWQFDAWRDWRWLVPFAVTLVGSLAWVALTVGDLEMPQNVILAALGIVTVLNLQGFGLILPGEIRVYREMDTADPNPTIIQQVGKRNAKLAGVQGAFQIMIIVVMVSLRYGGFPEPTDSISDPVITVNRYRHVTYASTHRLRSSYRDTSSVSIASVNSSVVD